MAGTPKLLLTTTALTATYTTNLYVPANTTADAIVRHIHITNKTAGAITFRIFIGATGANAAGTELFMDKSVAAFDVYDYYCALRLTSTDFMVGGASALTSLTITIEGELVAK